MLLYELHITSHRVITATILLYASNDLITSTNDVIFVSLIVVRMHQLLSFLRIADHQWYVSRLILPRNACLSSFTSISQLRSIMSLYAEHWLLTLAKILFSQSTHMTIFTLIFRPSLLNLIWHNQRVIVALSNVQTALVILESSNNLCRSCNVYGRVIVYLRPRSSLILGRLHNGTLIDGLLGVGSGDRVSLRLEGCPVTDGL